MHHQEDVKLDEMDSSMHGGAPAMAETGNVITSYVKNKLNRDVHKDLKTNKTVGNIHKNLKRHDARTEEFFNSIQIFTACVVLFRMGRMTYQMPSVHLLRLGLHIIEGKLRNRRILILGQ